VKIRHVITPSDEWVELPSTCAVPAIAAVVLGEPGAAPVVPVGGAGGLVVGGVLDDVQLRVRIVQGMGDYVVLEDAGVERRGLRDVGLRREVTRESP
jgi:hypothetical protein